MRFTVVKGRCDIYCARPTVFSNPFPITKQHTREYVIEQYRTYIKKHPELVKELYMHCKRLEVDGCSDIRLGCHCAPLPCHVDVLKEELEKLIGTN